MKCGEGRGNDFGRILVEGNPIAVKKLKRRNFFVFFFLFRSSEEIINGNNRSNGSERRNSPQPSRVRSPTETENVAPPFSFLSPSSLLFSILPSTTLYSVGLYRETRTNSKVYAEQKGTTKKKKRKVSGIERDGDGRG
jgi:hypothetical protein